MAFLKESRAKGKPYYSICESYRVNGKPRHRLLEYIGDFDALKKYTVKGYHAMHPENPASNETSDDPSIGSRPPPFPQGEIDANLIIRSASHGACMALVYTADYLGVIDILDSAFTQKTIKSFSRGTILLLAAVHRAISPGSKRSFAGWAAQTTLPYYFGFDANELTSQVFWEAMDGIEEYELQNAWERLIRLTLNLYDLPLSVFHLDYTNYFTFISSSNARCVFCKRGHNKQKRDDLRQFSLAALTAFELQIPLVWETYDGNTNDKMEFPEFVKEITLRFNHLGISLSDVTISFDGGSNSVENFAGLPFHIICAHSLMSFPELYDISIDEYTEITLGNGKKRRAYRIDNLTFSGITGTGILTYSQALKDGQVAQLNVDLKNASELALSVQERLNNPKSRIFSDLKKRKKEHERKQREAAEYNRELEEEEAKRAASGSKRRGRQKSPKPIVEWNEQQELHDIVSKAVLVKKYLSSFSSVSVTISDDGIYTVSLDVDKETKEAYIKKYYGKKLTCTDHTSWTTEQILREYCEQECIENGVFKISKDVDHFAVRPQYHWTDNKIRVHVFICLLALLLAEVLQKEMKAEGVQVITRQYMIETLNGIREGWCIIDDGTSKKNGVPRRFRELMLEEQRNMWNVAEKLKSRKRATYESSVNDAA